MKIIEVVVGHDMMNIVDDYDIFIRDYCRIIVQLIEKVLNIDIPLKASNKDVPGILDPLYSKEKIYERPVMNAKIGHKEENDINH